MVVPLLLALCGGGGGGGGGGGIYIYIDDMQSAVITELACEDCETA